MNQMTGMIYLHHSCGYIMQIIPTLENKWIIYMGEVNKYGRTVNLSEKE